jgi:hypothetical protein
MSADINNHIVRRHYTAHSGDNILSQVASVICIVTPDSLISAGIHPSGEILMVNSTQYVGEAWNCAFIENELLDEVLLADPSIIKVIFVATLKNIIIPATLFSGEEAAYDWLNAIYYCEKSEKMQVKHLGKSDAHCCYAFPENIEQCFTKHIGEAKILPLNYVHFHNGIHVENILQCTLTGQYAVATLHHNRLLHWHHTFEYSNAEDIAYQLITACQSFGIDYLVFPIRCTTINDTQSEIITKLHDLFPAMEHDKMSIASLTSPEWATTIHLFQQLNSCV